MQPQDQLCPLCEAETGLLVVPAKHTNKGCEIEGTSECVLQSQSSFVHLAELNLYWCWFLQAHQQRL